MDANAGIICITAVHGGAGYYEESQDLQVKKALKLACKQSASTLLQGASAVQAATDAIIVLEDDACLNAGYGSNLTLHGKVECDASIMDGQTRDYGSIGAVIGVKNPINAALAVLRHSQVKDKLGRIPPLLLVGGGAASFTRERGLGCVSEEEMICPRTKHEWEVWKARFDSSEAGIDAAQAGRKPWDVRDIHKTQDTVGAVTWDASERLAAGVSSGGLLLKHPGRVGEAAIYGAGCWASRSVACSISGCGEYIVRATLAKTIGDAITASRDKDAHGVLENVLNDFRRSCEAQGEYEPNVGVLLLVKELDEEDKPTPRLWCAFTTDSMAIAYTSSMNPKPRAMILRRPTRPDGIKSDTPYITAISLIR